MVTKILKKMKLSGVTLGRDGTLQSVELAGPSNVAMWEACCNVLLTVLVMVDAGHLGALLKYKQ